jgi:hypothetical protein
VVQAVAAWFGAAFAISTFRVMAHALLPRARRHLFSTCLWHGAGQRSGSRSRSRLSGAGAVQDGQGRDSARRAARINFNVRVRIDRPAEWAEMFDDGWRTMKYRFYDPKMHGMDWDAARAKYRPLVDFRGRPSGVAEHHQRDDW